MFNEFKSQCTIAVPTTVGLIFYKIPWMVSLHFVGVLGPEALAAAALATTLCNITGMSASVGLSSALMTLSGQARGHSLKQSSERENESDQEYFTISNDLLNESSTLDDDAKICEISPLLYSDHDAKVDMRYNNILHVNSAPFIKKKKNYEKIELPLLPLVFLYRGLIVSLAIALPIGLWWINGINKSLILLGLNPNLATMTSDYLRILVPGFWSYNINWTTNAWLQSLDMADVPAYSAFIGLLLHVPTNILFVNILGFGYKGVALATVLFQLLQTLMIYCYLFGSKKGRDRVLASIGVEDTSRDSLYSWAEMKIALFSLQGIAQYLELGIPGMIAISEWWASECCIFLAGTVQPFPDYAVGAMSIYQSINTFCFIFPIGFSTALTARVGMFLGRNEPCEAECSAWMGLLYASMSSVLISLILFLTPHTTFPSLFTSDEDVLLQCSHTIPFLAFYVVADGIQCGLSGAIKGCGKQCIMAPIVLFSYWVVGVPVSYYCTFVKNNGRMECGSKHFCGIRGLVSVFGLLSGTWVHMLLSTGIFVFAIDWKKEVKLAQERLATTHSCEDEQS